MDEAACLEIDRIAAHKLLIGLGLTAAPDLVARAAIHMAEHRLGATRWVVERTHANILTMLEARSTDYLAYKSEDWAEGYQFAEMQVATMTPDILADLAPERPRSKGQILRQMLRQARTRSRSSRDP